MASWSWSASIRQHGGILLFLGLLVIGTQRVAGGSVPSTRITKRDLNFAAGEKPLEHIHERYDVGKSPHNLRMGNLRETERARLLLQPVTSHRREPGYSEPDKDKLAASIVQNPVPGTRRRQRLDTSRVVPLYSEFNSSLSKGRGRGSTQMSPKLQRSFSTPGILDQKELPDISSGSFAIGPLQGTPRRLVPELRDTVQFDPSGQNKYGLNDPSQRVPKSISVPTEHNHQYAPGIPQLKPVGDDEPSDASPPERRPGPSSPDTTQSNRGKQSEKMVLIPVAYPGRVVLVPPRPVYYYYAYPAVLRPVLPVNPTILNVPVLVNVHPVAAPGPPPGGVLVGSGVQVTVSGVPGTYGYGAGRFPDSAGGGTHGLSRSPRYG